jgi:hypothetical protein
VVVVEKLLILAGVHQGLAVVAALQYELLHPWHVPSFAPAFLA